MKSSVLIPAPLIAACLLGLGSSVTGQESRPAKPLLRQEAHGAKSKVAPKVVRPHVILPHLFVPPKVRKKWDIIPPLVRSSPHQSITWSPNHSPIAGMHPGFRQALAELGTARASLQGARTVDAARKALDRIERATMSLRRHLWTIRMPAKKVKAPPAPKRPVLVVPLKC